MTVSLLQHPGKTILLLTAFVVFGLSVAAHSEPGAFDSNGNSDYLRTMYPAWGQDSGTGPGYYEGNDAVSRVTENLLKYWWRTAADNNPGLDRYNAVVSGGFSARHNGVDYGLRFTTDSVKLRLQYRF